MAGGRRCPGGRSNNTRLQDNTTNNSKNNNSATNLNNNCYNNIEDGKKNVNEQMNSGRTLAPKHIPVPSLSINSQIYFEALSLTTSLVVAALQLLNLYKTVWWLPQSYNEYSINFYLMDMHLVIFILTMAARQLLYALLCKFMDNIISQRWLPYAQKVLRIVLLILVAGISLWCLYYTMQKHSIIKILYLCYPSVSLYFLMFGFSIGPFFNISSPPLYMKEDKKTKFLLDKPLHNCSLNPVAIRTEIASLQSDFNKRLKKAFFAASVSAYLCGVTPLIFVPQNLHYDLGWVVQFIIFIWIGRLGTHLCQNYPFRYCDVLHRAALHLGRWTKLNGTQLNTAVQSWNDSTAYPNCSIVRHHKELYQSDGICTAAEPGNLIHQRFYKIFGNPTVLQCFLFCAELTLIAVQFMILMRETEWFKTLSMSLLLSTNLYTLYKLFRDYLISYKLYRTEQIIQEKAQATLANNTQ